MSQPLSNLSLFRKKVRSKLRLSIYMGRLLHFMYLAVKNYPDDVGRYETFWHLITDTSFSKKVLLKEGRFGKVESDPLKYLRLAQTLRERGYVGLLELADIIWDLTVHHKRIDHRSLFNSIIGMKSGFLDMIKFVGRVSYRHNPFAMNIKLFNFIVVEAELGERTGALAKTLIYIGRLSDSNRSLGLFTKFSIRSIDAEYMLSTQRKGNTHLMLKMFRLYPTVLRMQRFAYKKVKARSGLDSEMLNMLSELYVDEKALHSIINVEAPANILAMAPSISLNGGLCFVVAFQGELLDVLSTEAKVRTADETVKAYPAYYSALPLKRYPGEYLFIAFLPFTIPRVSLIVATLPVNLIDKIKPRRRNVLSLNKLFPKVREVVTRIYEE